MIDIRFNGNNLGHCKWHPKYVEFCRSGFSDRSQITEIIISEFRKLFIFRRKDKISWFSCVFCFVFFVRTRFYFFMKIIFICEIWSQKIREQKFCQNSNLFVQYWNFCQIRFFCQYSNSNFFNIQNFCQNLIFSIFKIFVKIRIFQK